MDEDKFALVEKIIKDVDNVMMKNAELYAFEIIPVEANFQNKSPVLHLENCLGLESWCVKYVYMYCYSELMDNFMSKPKKKAVKPSTANAERLTGFLNLTLLINPDVSSFWNKRRELVVRALVQKSYELLFSKLVLSRKCKCNDAFSYRRWLLEDIFRDKDTHSNYISSIITEELHICELASEKSPNNYHSWNHRMWVINQLKNCRQCDIQLVLMKEYEFSERWTAKHVSDHSCFHYRQFCIQNIFSLNIDRWNYFENIVNHSFKNDFVTVIAQNLTNEITFEHSRDDLIKCSEESLINLLLSTNSSYINDNVAICLKLEVLFHELILNNELLRYYKYHETMWYHRRFIVHEIINVMYNHFGIVRNNNVLVKSRHFKISDDHVRDSSNAKIVKYDCNRIYSCLLFIVLLSFEKKFIEERRNDGDNYADRHEKYLKYVEGLNNLLSNTNCQH